MAQYKVELLCKVFVEAPDEGRAVKRAFTDARPADYSVRSVRCLPDATAKTQTLAPHNGSLGQKSRMD